MFSKNNDIRFFKHTFCSCILVMFTCIGDIVNGDECNPRDFLVVDSLAAGYGATTRYCTGDYKGWWCNDGGTLIVGSCLLAKDGYGKCQYRASDDCDLKTKCKCVSNFGDTIQMYHNNAPCKVCGRGEYNSGCGCISNSNDKNNFKCSEGTCIKCPRGYKCPLLYGTTDKSFYAIPCIPRSEYQDLEGQTTCKRCTCGINQYVSSRSGCCFDDPNNENCISVAPLQCASCSLCDDAGGSCPAAASNYITDNDNKCKACENYQCNHPLYSPGVPDRKYCYLSNVDKPVEAKCDEFYIDISQTETLGTSDEDKATDPGWQIKRIITHGKMMWKPGYRRNVPKYPIAITGNGGRRGQVPYYTECDKDVWGDNKYNWTNNSVRIKFLNGDYNTKVRKWDLDCSIQYAGECDNTKIPRYTIKTIGNESTQLLSSCVACPADSLLNATTGRCHCNNGFITRQNLTDSGKFSTFYVSTQDQCIDCDVTRGEILFQLKNDTSYEWLSQAMKCTDGKVELAPNENSYLNVVQWHQCEEGEIPNPKRNGCIPCHSSRQNLAYGRYTCAERCNSTTYGTSNLSTPCTPRIQTCETGKKLIHVTDPALDNRCEECATGCQNDEIKVITKGFGNNTCSGGDGIPYFGCMHWQGSMEFPFAYRLQYNTSRRQVVYEKCEEDKLPPYSYFVQFTPGFDSLHEVGKHCYFACLHGVNKRIQMEVYEDYERKIITRSYSDSWIQYMQIQSNHKTAIRSNTFKKKSVKSMNYSNQNLISGQGDWLYDQNYDPNTTMAFVRQSIIQNTFFFDPLVRDDEFKNIYNNLCLSPEIAYSNDACDLPFTKAEPKYADQSMAAATTQSYVKCAYDARENLVFGGPSPQRYYVLNSDSQSVCEMTYSDDPSLEKFEKIGCTENCYTRLQEEARSNRRKYFTPDEKSMWNNLQEYLSFEEWNDSGSQSPYVFLNTNCSFTCTSGNIKVEFTTTTQPEQTIRVCVPNDATRLLSEFCSIQRRILNTVDVRLNQMLSFDQLCLLCPQITDSTLIYDLDEQALWWDTKSNTGDTRYTTTNAWQKLPCKYKCNEGYYSNPSFNSYSNRPCIQCPDPHLLSCPDDDAYYLDLVQCSQGTYKHLDFTQQCKRCRNNETRDLRNMLVYDKNGGYYTQFSQCKAQCDPSQYLTYVLDSKGNTSISRSGFILVGNIVSCTPCTVHPEEVCNGHCFENYYMSANSSCTKCVYSRCTNPSQYREKCSGSGNSPPACFDCPLNYLQNNVEISIASDNKHFFGSNEWNTEEIQDIKNTIFDLYTRNVPTRKYVSFSSLNISNRVPAFFVGNLASISSSLDFSDSTFQKQCIIVCENNYVWIDLLTKEHPFSIKDAENSSPRLYNHSRYVCIPCESNLIKQDLLDKTPQLWSIWNQKNMNNANLNYKTQSQALYKMSVKIDNVVDYSLYGGCYACVKNDMYVTQSNGTVLCELNAGYSASQSQDKGTANIIFSTVPKQLSLNFRASTVSVASPASSRRRLLQATATSSDVIPTLDTLKNEVEMSVFNIRKIRVYKHPNFKLNTENHYRCCYNFKNSRDVHKCKIRKLLALEKKTNAVGVLYGNDYCDNVNKESIVSQNRRRLLQTVVNEAQNNTFPSYNNQSNGLNPKYESEIVEQDNDMKCPSGTFKEGIGDGQCLICPSGSSTVYPYTGSDSRSQCVCLEGYKTVYLQNTLSSYFSFRCEACGFNYFKSYDSSIFANDTYCLPCPKNMITPTSSCSSCYCQSGYYLNETLNECIPCRPGWYCLQGIQTQCPVFSSSAALSFKRSHCTCNAGTHYGILDEGNSQCMDLYPGAIEQCKCGQGWILKKDPLNPANCRCMTPCQLGEYANVQDGKIISGCVKCPINTYSFTPQSTSIENCLPCPKNRFTMNEGATNISDCLCISNNNNTQGASLLLSDAGVVECESCKEGYYLNKTTNGFKSCMKCPNGLSSMRDAQGPESCFLCPVGFRTQKKMSSEGQFLNYECEPCPLGSFSMTLGTKCTPCPAGFTTKEAGSTSPLYCMKMK